MVLRLIGARDREHVAVRDRNVLEPQVQCLGAFKSGKIGAVMERQSLCTAVCGKHDVAFILDRGGDDDQMILADVGHPRQRAVDDIAVTTALGAEVNLFDAREVLD